MSVRGQILAAIRDRLKEAPAVAASIHLRRASDLNERDYPAVVIVPGPTPVRNAQGRVSEHSMSVVVAAITTGRDAEDAAEALAQAVLDAVKTDDTWGGLATDTFLASVAEDKEQVDKLRFGVALTLTVRFETGLWTI